MKNIVSHLAIVRRSYKSSKSSIIYKNDTMIGYFILNRVILNFIKSSIHVMAIWLFFIIDFII